MHCIAHAQGLIARLQAGAWRGWDGEKGREAELVHLYETLGQGAGEATRLLTAGEHDGVPEDVLTLAQVGTSAFGFDAVGAVVGWWVVVVGQTV